MRMVTVTFKFTPEQCTLLARKKRVEVYEVGTVILDDFIRTTVADALDRLPRRVAPPTPQTMTIVRKRRRSA